MPRGHRSIGRTAAAALVAVLVAVVAACGGGGGGASDSPEGVVRTAMDKMAAMDVEGLAALACEGQEDTIRDQLGLPGSVGAGELLPGLDTQELLEAIRLDVSKVEVGTASVEGDVAEVPIEGDLGVTFDAEAMRPIMRQMLGAQGESMTDEQLDALLAGLEAYGQAVPLDSAVRLVREDGAWKVCQENVTP